MLGSKNAVATLPVKDLPKAREFYERTLGLEVEETEGEEAVTYRAGDHVLFVYRSQFAGGNHATAVTWTVGGDLDKIVRELNGKGVTFEHYDMPGLKRDGDIHRGDGMDVAWFKDHDGNIHGLVSG